MLRQRGFRVLGAPRIGQRLCLLQRPRQFHKTSLLFSDPPGDNKNKAEEAAVKFLLKMTPEGRKILKQIKEKPQEAAPLPPRRPEIVQDDLTVPMQGEMDRTNKVINTPDSNILESDPNDNYVHGFNERFFHVADYALYGSIIVLQKTSFMWRVQSIADITIESLAVFELLNPKPQLLFIGCGAEADVIDPKVVTHFEKMGITIEALSTADATSTFNFLLQEDRNVAGAFLPSGYREEY